MIFVKYIEGVLGKVLTEETKKINVKAVIIVILVLNVILKMYDPNYYNSLINDIRNNFVSTPVVVKFIELINSLATLFSICLGIVLVFMLIRYWLATIFIEKFRLSTDSNSYPGERYHRFYLGTWLLNDKVSSWVTILYGYLYIGMSNEFFRIYNELMSIFNNNGIVYKLIIILFVINLINGVYINFNNVYYNLFYFYKENGDSNK